MPYTTHPKRSRALHIWTEELVPEEPEPCFPLCDGGDPLGEHPSDLHRLEEVRLDMSGGKPRTIPEFVLWAEVCRECAELLADETDLRTAPVQWLKGVGSKRASKLKSNGVKTLADVWEYVEPLEVEGQAMPGLHSKELAFDTGIPEGVASRLLNQLVAEGWRRETDKSGGRP